MSTININNIKPSADSGLIRFTASYELDHLMSDQGKGLNVEDEHAIIVKPKSEINVSIRTEASGIWRTITIPARELTTIDVSEADLVNFYTLSSISSRKRKLFVKALYNSYSSDAVDLDGSIDDLSQSFGKIEWLPKITVVSS